MADKPKKQKDDDGESEDGAEESSGGISKKKLIVFAVIGLVFMSVSIGGTLLLLSSMNSSDEELSEIDAALDDSSEEKEAAPSKEAAIYIPIKPPFVVNFQARGKQRFLQVDVSLMSRDSDAINAVQMHMPLVRNALVLLFGSQSFAELQESAGKVALRKATLLEVQKIMEKEIGRPGIEDAFFTSFVMQ